MPVTRKYAGPRRPGERSAKVTKKGKRGIVNNYSTSVRASTGRTVIRPQNNVPKESVLGLRYKQTFDLTNLPVFVGPNNVEQSGIGITINMSDPLSDGLFQVTKVIGDETGSYQKSNSSTTGGQDNLRQALEDSGLADKYDHFYVKKSIAHVIIRAKPNQYKLDNWLQDQGTGTEADPYYLKTRYAQLVGDLYNFAVMSDRASVDLVNESVLKVRHQTAGIKLKKSQVFKGSTGKDCSFKLTYTPRRLGIKDPGDNRGLIGFTAGSSLSDRVQENSYAQFVIGKQMFPTNSKSSALSVVDIAVDYEIVACERRITNNDAVPRPLPGRGRGDQMGE